MKRGPLVVAATGVVAAVSAWIGVSYFAAWRITHPVRAPGAMSRTPIDEGASAERIEIPRIGGSSLPGWWLPATGERVAIVCYGYRGTCSDVPGIAARLWRRGFDVLLFEYSTHIPASGLRVTLGHAEARDAISVVDFARRRWPEATIGLVGYSMGGAVALIAAAARRDVSAVIADCPFASQRDIIRDRFRRVFRLPPAPFLPVVDVFLRRLAGYRFDDVSPLAAIGQISPGAVLLIHGDRDASIPVEHSLALFDRAGEPKELWRCDTGHCGAYFADPDGYADRVAAFLLTHGRATVRSSPVEDVA